MLEYRCQIWKDNNIIWKDYLPEITSIKYIYNDDNQDKFIHININNTYIINKDTTDCGLQLIKEGYNPLVLNMADIYHPGGCVSAGGGMQEESIFRRSNYHRHLSSTLYPIQNNEAIYSPNVYVFRDNEDNAYTEFIVPVFMSFVACPSISMPILTKCLFNETDIQIFINKIRLIFQIAHENNHDSIVLGALGCGAFGCPIKHVAKLFYLELYNTKYSFKNITFAILGKNCDMFRDNFNNKNI